MKKSAALGALNALAQENRLDIFRMLVTAGLEGLAAGAISERLGLVPANLSFHLNQLRYAGLVWSRREGRSIIYAANFDAMNGLVAYLTENCCEEAAQVPSAAGPRPVPTADRELNVLFLCTRNSARSVMAECALNRWGKGKFHAFSAGSHPGKNVHPMALQVLGGLRYETGGLRGKSWNEFADAALPNSISYLPYATGQPLKSARPGPDNRYARIGAWPIRDLGRHPRRQAPILPAHLQGTRASHQNLYQSSSRHAGAFRGRAPGEGNRPADTRRMKRRRPERIC
jgi:DNA-binding transcriptional ArsR family regulator